MSPKRSANCGTTVPWRGRISITKIHIQLVIYWRNSNKKTRNKINSSECFNIIAWFGRTNQMVYTAVVLSTSNSHRMAAPGKKWRLLLFFLQNYLLRFVHSPSTINRKRQFYCSLCFILMQFANAKLHSPFLTLKRAQQTTLALDCVAIIVGLWCEMIVIKWMAICWEVCWRNCLAAASPIYANFSLVYQFYRTFTIRKVHGKASLPHSSFRQADEE